MGSRRAALSLGPLVTAPHPRTAAPAHSRTRGLITRQLPASHPRGQTQEVCFLCYLVEQNWAPLGFEVASPLGQDGKVTCGTGWRKGQSRRLWILVPVVSSCENRMQRAKETRAGCTGNPRGTRSSGGHAVHATGMFWSQKRVFGEMTCIYTRVSRDSRGAMVQDTGARWASPASFEAQAGTVGEAGKPGAGPVFQSCRSCPFPLSDSKTQPIPIIGGGLREFVLHQTVKRFRCD